MATGITTFERRSLYSLGSAGLTRITAIGLWLNGNRLLSHLSRGLAVDPIYIFRIHGSIIPELENVFIPLVLITGLSLGCIKASDRRDHLAHIPHEPLQDKSLLQAGSTPTQTCRP